jgi:hypothetical protein
MHGHLFRRSSTSMVTRQPLTLTFMPRMRQRPTQIPGIDIRTVAADLDLTRPQKSTAPTLGHRPDLGGLRSQHCRYRRNYRCLGIFFGQASGANFGRRCVK